MASFISVTAWSMGITPVRVKNAACKADGRVTEPQMALCQAAGLLGVVSEVRLSVFFFFFADNFDRVLIATYSTVGAKSVELAGDSALCRSVNRLRNVY